VETEWNNHDIKDDRVHLQKEASSENRGLIHLHNTKPLERDCGEQQVRAIWNEDELLVCKIKIRVEDTPEDNAAGIDLDIKNYSPSPTTMGEAEFYLEIR
jgi:ribosome-interacting GTPase 1